MVSQKILKMLYSFHFQKFYREGLSIITHPENEADILPTWTWLLDGFGKQLRMVGYWISDIGPFITQLSLYV